MRQVDIAVFAHNEESAIGTLLDDLSRQTLLGRSDTKLRIRVLCNGCKDQTVLVAQETINAKKHMVGISAVDNFEQGGKSRTWNRFVSELLENSQFAIFMDGDIRLPDTDALLKLLEDLEQSSAVAVTSRPLKDLRSLQRNPIVRAAASSISREHRDGPICGQLYAVKTAEIRQIRLPVPCLVEDGFLSACLITALFTHPGMAERVKASPRVSHYFEAPGTLREFFRHDVRLALGTELNAALYSDLWAANSRLERIELLKMFSLSRGIDRCIIEHQKHPERSALSNKLIFNNLLGNKADQLIKNIIRIPFRFAHCLYMVLVQSRARKLFGEGSFRW